MDRTIERNWGSGCIGGDSLVLVRVPPTGTDIGDAIQHMYRAVHEVRAGDAVLCEGGVYLPVECTWRVPVDPAAVSSGLLPMVSVGGVTLTYDHPVMQDTCSWCQAASHPQAVPLSASPTHAVFNIHGAAMVLVPWHIHPTTRLGCCGV